MTTNVLILSVYALLLFACVCEVFNRRRFAVLLLFGASLVAGYWAIGLDPFLNDWDERFHALVAKNLTYDLLHPTLFKTPLLSYDYKDWSGNHTWIHKQPMFLWIISFSIKIFGALEKSVRLPSMMMVSLMVLMVYRMASRLSNGRTAFIAALLTACHYTYLQNMSGNFLVDHNNIAFLFFVTLSFACWIEFEFSENVKWLYWMAVAVGCAVLVKWLVGLLVFVPFVLNRVVVKRDFFEKEIFLGFVKSIGIALLVVVPWQVYCYVNFTKEFLFEMAFNARHFWQALEGHEGGWDYYIKSLPQDYYGIYWLVVPSLASLLLTKKNQRLNQFLLLSVLIIYTFFSLVATKMPQYAIIASPFVLYGMALFIDKILTYLQSIFSSSSKWVYAGCFTIICLGLAHQNFAFKTIEGWHWRNPEEAVGRYKNYKNYCKAYFRALDKTYSPQNSVVVFCSQNLDCMFYSDFVAYDWLDANQINTLKQTGRKVLVFNRPDLPEYVRNDRALVVLDNEVLN